MLPDIMIAAAHEMRRLRRENELLRVRVDAFELCATMVLARPPEHRPQGYSEDYADCLEKEAHRMQEKAKLDEVPADCR